MATEKSSLRGTSSRMPPKIKQQISVYNKKQLLIMLKESNCHPKELQSMIKRFRLDDENIIKEFVNTQAELSQDRIEEKCRLKLNRHFLHLDQCAKNLCSERESTTDNTLPVTLEAIANLDTHPKPEEVNGVDLKVLYQMLANLCAGYPIEELENGPTKEFLKQCYTELMDSVSEMDAKTFRDLLTEQDKQTQPVYSWLCNSDYSQYLMKIFKDMCQNDNNHDDEDDDDHDTIDDDDDNDIDDE